MQCLAEENGKLIITRYASVAINISDLDDVQTHEDLQFIAYQEHIKQHQSKFPLWFPESPPTDSLEYTRIGQAARLRGVSHRTYNELYEPAPSSNPSEEIELLPWYHPSEWNMFEGTLNNDILHDRYSTLPRWNNNSCASDAVLFAGIYSDAAIQRADAISLTSWRCLTAAQKMFREILCLAWGRMN